MRADARANQQRILTAATDLFASEGLDVSLDEIARHANVGPGTLHRHFPRKDELIAAVALERLELFAAAAHRRAGSSEPVAALHDQLAEMIVAGDDSAPLKQALARTPDDIVWSQTDVSERLRDALGVLLSKAQKTGAVRPDIDANDLMSLLAGCYGAIQRAKVAADSPTGKRLINVLLAGLSRRI